MWRLRLTNDVRQMLFLVVILSSTLVMMSSLTTQKHSDFLRHTGWEDIKAPPVDVNCSYFQSHDFRSWSAHVQRERLSRVTDVCRQWKPQGNLTVAMLNHILVDDYHKVIYCSIPKVACTNWKKVFVQFSPHSSNSHAWNVHTKRFMERMGLRYLNTYNKSEILHRVQNYFKFMFVRNPLERLLSAFKDKFTVYNKYTKHFRHKYAKKIIKRYRKDGATKDELRFGEFVKYLIDLQDSEEPFNPHWAHYSDLCQPCRISYDYIGKMETMKWDAQSVLQRIGGSTGCQRLPSYLDQPQKTAPIMDHYYQNISKEDLRKLVDVYSADFKLFDYSPIV